MLVATVQRYNHLVDSCYSPNILKNRFARMNKKCMKGYFEMFDMLSSEGGTKIRGVDSGYWCWVDNPYLALHVQYDSEEYAKRLFLCVYDVPEDKIVVSDYDKWCLYMDNKVDCLGSCICSTKDIGTGRCLQGVCWDLDLESAICVCPLSAVAGYQFKDIRGLKAVCEKQDEKFLLTLDKFSKDIENGYF